MRYMRAFFFVFGCFECVALGQSVTLHDWREAGDSIAGALFMFTAFFVAPFVRSFLTREVSG